MSERKRERDPEDVVERGHITLLPPVLYADPFSPPPILFHEIASFNFQERKKTALYQAAVMRTTVATTCTFILLLCGLYRMRERLHALPVYGRERERKAFAHIPSRKHFTITRDPKEIRMRKSNSFEVLCAAVWVGVRYSSSFVYT